MLMVIAICSFLCCCQKQKNSSSLAIPMADRIDSLSTDYSNYVLNMILIVNFNYLGYWPSSSLKMKCHALMFNPTLQKVLCTILLSTTNEVILWSPLDSWELFLIEYEVTDNPSHPFLLISALPKFISY
jgi:hypothetical protein